MVPQAAFRALRSNSNKAEDWLPSSYTESSDLSWFRDHFSSGSFLLCTWPGCTLGNTDQLDSLVGKLSKHLVPEEFSAAGGPEQTASQTTIKDNQWFRKFITGPSMIAELGQAPLSLSAHDAAVRLEGSLVGPRKTDGKGELLGELLDDASRQTCLVIYLSPEGYHSNKHMRMACEEIERLAVEECGVPKESFCLGGPPADNVAIDQSAEESFTRLSSVSALVGLVLAFWCYRSLRLTGIVVSVGAMSANVALAIVSYYGVVEVLFGGLTVPHLGTMDAVMMTMPAVVYVLGVSGAVHIVNYYIDMRREHGILGAAERAARVAWTPCALAAITTAVGLGSLATSDIVPIKKFGAFTAVAVLTTLAVMFTVLPVFLHRFPPKLRAPRPKSPGNGLMSGGLVSEILHRLQAAGQFIVVRHNLVAVCGIAVMLFAGFGLLRLESSVRVLKLLDSEADLISDYAWIEENLANVVPMEVVLTIPNEKCREPNEHAEADGQRYRMSMVERLNLVRRLVSHIEELPAVSRTISAATFAPEPSGGRETYSVNKALQENRESLDDYLRNEMATTDPETAGPETANGRQLWRIAARVAAIQDVDYGEFVGQIQGLVAPVLLAHKQRDSLVEQLHANDKQLGGSKLCVLFYEVAREGEQATIPPAMIPPATIPPENTPARILGELLQESGIRQRVEGQRGQLSFYNLANLADSKMPKEERTKIVELLQSQDAVVLAGQIDSSLLELLSKHNISKIDLTNLPTEEGSAAIAATGTEAPRSIRAVYTGIVPLVFKTQRQLLVSLTQSMIWAVVLIAAVMAFVLRNPIAGALSMIPNVFPVVLIFGFLGWIGTKIDIGIMMTASVALGVAVDDTVHFLTWFRRGTRQGLNRRDATWLAYERCAAAMTQTTLIAGLGLAVFAFSSFTPTQQFGTMMITMLAAALIGDLVLLPAILCGPLGRAFAGSAPKQKPEQKNETSTGPTDIQRLPVHTNSKSSDSQSSDSQNSDSQNSDSHSDEPDSVAPSNGVSPNSDPNSDPNNGEPSTPPVRRMDEMELNSPNHSKLRQRLQGFRRDSSRSE